MACGCGGPRRFGIDGIWARPWFTWLWPRTNPTKIDPQPNSRLSMDGGGHCLEFEAAPFFDVEERPQRTFPAHYTPPSFYIPVDGRQHSLADRFTQLPNGFVRPYTAGFQRGMTQAIWFRRMQGKYQPIRTVLPLHRAGPQDARTALAVRQGPALQFPRWFTGGVDEDDLVERARRKVKARRGR